MYNPTTLSLYLTQYCPLRCKYCIFGSQKKEHMATEYALKRINEAAELGINHVVLTGGEPTLHPDFLLILNEIIKKDMSVLIVTNGIPIDDDKLKKMIEYNKSSIYVSLDCYDEEINDKYRDKNAFKYVINTMKKIREINPHKFIGVNSILVKETLELLPKTADFILNELKANVMNVERVIRVGNSESIINEAIITDMRKYWETINPLVQKYPNTFRVYTCNLHTCLLNAPSSFIILIFPDENIYLCCNLPDEKMKIGDTNSSLEELLQGDDIKRIASVINKHFFEKSKEIREKVGIFGCVECVEEYKRLRNSGKLEKIFKKEKIGILKKIKNKLHSIIN